MANYNIKKGDTLSQIAKAQGTTVAALQAANPALKNPNMIQAGATLVIPTANPANPLVVVPPRTTNPTQATMPPAPVPVTPAPPTPTTGTSPTAANGWGTQIYVSPEDADRDRIAKERFEASQKPDEDPSTVARRYAGMFQAEIDAINNMFQNQIAQARVAGEDKLGRRRAANFRSGLGASERGEAMMGYVRT